MEVERGRGGRVEVERRRCEGRDGGKGVEVARWKWRGGGGAVRLIRQHWMQYAMLHIPSSLVEHHGGQQDGEKGRGRGGSAGCRLPD